LETRSKPGGGKNGAGERATRAQRVPNGQTTVIPSQPGKKKREKEPPPRKGPAAWRKPGTAPVLIVLSPRKKRGAPRRGGRGSSPAFGGEKKLFRLIASALFSHRHREPGSVPPQKGRASKKKTRPFGLISNRSGGRGRPEGEGGLLAQNPGNQEGFNYAGQRGLPFQGKTGRPKQSNPSGKESSRDLAEKGNVPANPACSRFAREKKNQKNARPQIRPLPLRGKKWDLCPRGGGRFAFSSRRPQQKGGFPVCKRTRFPECEGRRKMKGSFGGWEITCLGRGGGVKGGGGKLKTKLFPWGGNNLKKKELAQLSHEQSNPAGHSGGTGLLARKRGNWERKTINIPTFLKTSGLNRGGKKKKEGSPVAWRKEKKTNMDYDERPIQNKPSIPRKQTRTEVMKKRHGVNFAEKNRKRGLVENGGRSGAYRGGKKKL